MAGKLYTSYTGFPSFFSSKISSVEDVEEGTLVVAGVPIDQGVVTGRPGSRYGPRGIREASMQHRGAYEVSAEKTLMDVETGIWRKPVAFPPLIDIGDFDINPHGHPGHDRNCYQRCRRCSEEGRDSGPVGGRPLRCVSGICGLLKGDDGAGRGPEARVSAYRQPPRLPGRPRCRRKIHSRDPGAAAQRGHPHLL